MPFDSAAPASFSRGVSSEALQILPANHPAEHAAERMAERARAAAASGPGQFDFSRVRVITGPAAAASAAGIQARAYTVGEKIVFDRGQYAPGTAAGQALLAHELAHVVQGLGPSTVARQVRSAPIRPACGSKIHGTGKLENLFRGTLEHYLVQFDFIMRNVLARHDEWFIPESSSKGTGNDGWADVVDTSTGDIWEIKPKDLEGDAVREAGLYVTKANQFCGPRSWKLGTGYRPSQDPLVEGDGFRLRAWQGQPGTILYEWEFDEELKKKWNKQVLRYFASRAIYDALQGKKGTRVRGLSETGESDTTAPEQGGGKQAEPGPKPDGEKEGEKKPSSPDPDWQWQPGQAGKPANDNDVDEEIPIAAMVAIAVLLVVLVVLLAPEALVAGVIAAIGDAALAALTWLGVGEGAAAVGATIVAALLAFFAKMGSAAASDKPGKTEGEGGPQVPGEGNKVQPAPNGPPAKAPPDRGAPQVQQQGGQPLKQAGGRSSLKLPNVPPAGVPQPQFDVEAAAKASGSKASGAASGTGGQAKAPTRQQGRARAMDDLLRQLQTVRSGVKPGDRGNVEKLTQIARAIGETEKMMKLVGEGEGLVDALEAMRKAVQLIIDGLPHDKKARPIPTPGGGGGAGAGGTGGNPGAEKDDGAKADSGSSSNPASGQDWHRGAGEKVGPKPGAGKAPPSSDSSGSGEAGPQGNQGQEPGSAGKEGKGGGGAGGPAAGAGGGKPGANAADGFPVIFEMGPSQADGERAGIIVYPAPSADPDGTYALTNPPNAQAPFALSVENGQTVLKETATGRVVGQLDDGPVSGFYVLGPGTLRDRLQPQADAWRQAQSAETPLVLLLPKK